MVGIYSLLLCLCTVTDFSAAEKDSVVKLRMLVRLLSGMSFSHFGELWPRGGSQAYKYEARWPIFRPKTGKKMANKSRIVGKL